MRFFSIFSLTLLVFLSSVTGVLAGTDPYFNSQWYLQEIRATEAWSTSKGNPAVIVAVIDTGVDIDNPDIQPNIWVNTDEVPGDGVDNDGNGYIDDYNGYDFVSGVGNPSPKLTNGYTSSGISHGTFLAGIISAVHENNFGIKGITANVKIMPLIGLGSNGQGTSSAVYKAVDYAVNNGAHIINLSFGGDEYDVALKNSIANAYNKGVLVVAAGGNALSGGTGKDATNSPVYPICYDQGSSVNMILGVVALTQADKIASYSNYGAGCIDIAAPGDNITSLAYQNANYATLQDYVKTGWYGSSFAAAMVSGAAALLKSVNTSLMAKDLIKLIKEESALLIVDPKYSGKVGDGRLDIRKAMDKVLSASGAGAPVTILPGYQQVTAPTTSISPAPSTDSLFYVSTKTSGSGRVHVYNSQYQKVKELDVLGGAEFHGLNLSVADVNLDGYKDIVASAVKGDQPFVRVVDEYGVMLSSFLAFEPNFKGGINAAAGDVDGDGQVEIVVVADSGREPVVRIFDKAGIKKAEFMAYNKSFTNGLSLVVGDVEGDGQAEIIVAPHKGLMPKVKVFNSKGSLEKEITAYAASFTGGVNLGLGDIDGNNILDILTAAGTGGGPHVQAFNSSGTRLVSFMAYNTNMTSGVYVRSFDWNRDGKAEIVTVAAAPGGPHVRIFNRTGVLIGEFFPFPVSFTGGVSVEAR
ncbi:MAG: peptidase S8 and S53, subtilisin, kexin, sedolisin [Parcubacteria group bacterium GW2011_GWC2_39_14]|nr:MAG: peptidase S8 and S53, subtilisin, kexin, sedolisin [Parcubacteria group bacterium GW2011_GWC2_39_14]KKR55525.1 MAG: peptidase S8 and S53, subtilisin, kexin, sedolisin [Parcubacteria group bacterium GW2011_GWA2_40_23]